MKALRADRSVVAHAAARAVARFGARPGARGMLRGLSPALLGLFVGTFACSLSAWGQMAVTGTSPLINAGNVGRSAPVSITFDRAVNPATFSGSNIKVFGKLTGPMTGTLSYTNANQTVTFTPSHPFLAGEVVMVTLSHNLLGADAVALRPAGYVFMYTCAVTPSYHKFTHKATISNRDSSGDQTRIYGGLACDLNRDGYADLTTVNEVSADLRVFLNSANGSGLFNAMSAPYTPIPYESSPNEVADFNNDGFIDIVTSSNASNEIAIVFGNGNGTFQTPVVRSVGSYPRGFGVFDMDGDGDYDIAVANASSNNVSVLLNNGSGTFGPVTNISVPGGPYGMTAADMNNDGILDLVTGGVADQTCRVLRGNGNATFTQIAARSLGGSNWVVQCADLNGDRLIDVSCANSTSNNGSILLNTGGGTLGPAAVHATNGHTVSTDLADLDGDGDQDWVLSAFGAGEWYVLINNGAGVMSPDVTVPAPSNPSCAVPMDLDNDGDIDLVLTDEIADVLVLMDNSCSIDFNNDGLYPDTQDIDDFLSVFSGGPCSNAPNCGTIDFNNDGLFPDTGDIDALLSVFSGGPCV